jgi:hypothetical protein
MKLGRQVGLGWEKQEIDTDKNIATAKGAVKEQWQKEREEAKAKPSKRGHKPVDWLASLERLGLPDRFPYR